MPLCFSFQPSTTFQSFSFSKFRHFKAAKSALKLGDIPSANPRIMKTLMWASIAAASIVFPMTSFLMNEQIERREQSQISLLRSVEVISHLWPHLMTTILYPSRASGDLVLLMFKAGILEKEVSDPYRGRKTVWKELGAITG